MVRMKGWGVLYRFILKIQYSAALTIAGHDVSFALTASPGQPGCYTLKMHPGQKETLSSHI